MSEASGAPAQALPRATDPTILRAPALPVPARYPTMAEVARRVGVHHTTVSLALRDHPSIPPTTRARIRAAASELGYICDPLLDAFNQHRLRKREIKQAPSIGFIVDARCSPFWEGEAYNPIVLQGTRAVADAHHFALEVFPLGPRNLTDTRLNTILSSRGISGLILSTFNLDTSSINLEWEKYSAVKIESHHVLPELDVISSDQCQAARVAMRRLRDLGYRRIGLATARDDELRLKELFTTGVLVEQSELPESECVPPLLFTRADIPEVAARIADWVRDQKIEAVISNWNEVIGLTKWTPDGCMLGTTGLRIPHEVAWASLDVPNRPELAGVVQNHRLVGLHAMEQLSVLMKTNQIGPPATPSATFVPGYWRDGASAPRKTRR